MAKRADSLTAESKKSARAAKHDSTREAKKSGAGKKRSRGGRPQPVPSAAPIDPGSTRLTAPLPVATYRLQLTEEFGFLAVIQILEHLRDLGISHLYLSPIGTATAGSTHGYDWLPPPQVAPRLGGIDGLRALRAAAASVGIGIIIDIVPNHTGVADTLANPWFTDLLRHGKESEYAEFFDVDFGADNGSDGRIALPVLAADGDLTPLTVDMDAPGGPLLRYYDHAFPIAPGTTGSKPEGSKPKKIHSRQHYRLVPWNSGLIGYRRFFTVNELAGLRQESPQVYIATHGWIRRLLDDNLIDGIRVDHPDGLWEPEHYLRQLRADVGPDRLLFIEKILAHDEPLEPTLPVQGTTGYDQLRTIEAVFTAPSGVVALGEIHDYVTGTGGDAHVLVEAEREQKLLTLRESFPTEHRRLVRAIRDSPPNQVPAGGAEDQPASENVSDDQLATATAELIAELGVYRADYPSLRPRLLAAAARITGRNERLAGAVAEVIRATSVRGAAASRLAQTCGAVTAKSVEDALFYRTARLVSTQEVGCDPANPVLTLREFHDHNASRASLWPQAMTATSTHDTKRGEDVRARIALLAQVPERWSLLVHELMRRTPPPDALTGYFLLQNIIGVWPIGGLDNASEGNGGEENGGEVGDSGENGTAPPVIAVAPLRERLVEYARKATREAGLHTTWTAVNEEFESSVTAWIDALLSDEAQTIDRFVQLIAPAWQQESLARKAIALLGPGIPDIYQGTEWFEDSLVDPDNRRPVDYRQSTNHPKAELIRTALALRSAYPETFGPTGNYQAILADGPAADHVVAFSRGVDTEPTVLVITARFTYSLHETAAEETAIALPWGQWQDQHGVTHESTVTLAQARARGPVAILTRTN